MSAPHLPVLAAEILSFFEGDLSIVVDGTLGAGGHAEAILRAHPELDRYIGIDQDSDARKIATKRLEEFSAQLTVAASNFQEMGAVLADLGIAGVDAILLDLGVSSMQLDRAERGFSFMREGPLDMRMDREQELTAATICNEWEEREIIRILREYGEEPRARRVAQAIVKGRPFATTTELGDAIRPALRRKTPSRTNPLTRTFQGLRIAVNQELDVVRAVLPQAIEALKPGGKLAVITFHSLEDRLVKRYFQEAASDKENTSGLSGLFLDKDPIVKILTRKPIIATSEEQEVNPRSRSAKLRVVEKL